MGVEPASEVAAAEASSEVPALAMSDLEFEPMPSRSMMRGPSPIAKMLFAVAVGLVRVVGVVPRGDLRAAGLASGLLCVATRDFLGRPEPRCSFWEARRSANSFWRSALRASSFAGVACLHRQ